MPLIVNGTTVEKVLYNATELETLIYNGVTIFNASQRIIVTVGFSGVVSGAWGYSAAGNYGAINPTTYDGKQITGLAFNPNAHRFYFGLVGEWPKTLISKLNVEGFGDLLTSAATHQAGSGATEWTWTVGGNGGWTSGGTKNVDIYP